MAKTIELKLVESYAQPVVEINEVLALISTGVAVPVFSIPQDMLKDLYGAEVVSAHRTLGGMSGKLEGDILQLKDFHMGELNFPVLDVFCPQEPIKKFPFIISNTMLYGLAYSFNMIPIRVCYRAAFRAIIESGNQDQLFGRRGEKSWQIVKT